MGKQVAQRSLTGHDLSVRLLRLNIEPCVHRTRILAISILAWGLASCAHHAAFDPVTEYIFENEFFITVDDARSPGGPMGKACPGTPSPYTGCRGPGLGSEGDPALDAYLDWRRTLCVTWAELLTAPPGGQFNEKAYRSYCRGNRSVWEQNPETEAAVGRIATDAFRRSGLLDLLVARARESDSPPPEVPPQVKNAVHLERPAIMTTVHPPSGQAQIFKYCQVTGHPAVVSNISTAEQAHCYEIHLALMGDAEYSEDFDAWVTRINRDVEKVPWKEGERFQQRMYRDLEETKFYPRLRVACGAEEAP